MVYQKQSDILLIVEIKPSYFSMTIHGSAELIHNPKLHCVVLVIMFSLYLEAFCYFIITQIIFIMQKWLINGNRMGLLERRYNSEIDFHPLVFYFIASNTTSYFKKI